MITIKEESYLTPKETAIFVGRSISTVYQKWKVYGWSPYHFGATLLFKENDLSKWLESQLKEGTPSTSSND